MKFIQRHRERCVVVESTDNVSLVILHFLRLGKIVGHTFLLAPLCHGVMGVTVCLSWGLGCIGLFYVVDRWAWSPLATRAVLVTCGSEPFTVRTTLSTSRMIPGTVYKWSPLHLLGSISSRVLGTDSLF
jgi:hypothetical protein